MFTNVHINPHLPPSIRACFKMKHVDFKHRKSTTAQIDTRRSLGQMYFYESFRFLKFPLTSLIPYYILGYDCNRESHSQTNLEIAPAQDKLFRELTMPNSTNSSDPSQHFDQSTLDLLQEVLEEGRLSRANLSPESDPSQRKDLDDLKTLNEIQDIVATQIPESGVLAADQRTLGQDPFNMSDGGYKMKRLFGLQREICQMYYIGHEMVDIATILNIDIAVVKRVIASVPAEQYLLFLESKGDQDALSNRTVLNKLLPFALENIAEILIDPNKEVPLKLRYEASKDLLNRSPETAPHSMRTVQGAVTHKVDADFLKQIEQRAKKRREAEGPKEIAHKRTNILAAEEIEEIEYNEVSNG